MRTHVLRTLGRLSRAIPPFKGKTRLVRALDRSVRWLGPDTPAFHVDVGDVTFEVDPAEHIQFNLLYHGSFGDNVLAALTRAARGRPCVVWDIGANIGAISLKLAAACPLADIHAFEPSPDIFAQLTRNLALNPRHAAHITARQVALSDTVGAATFFGGKDGNSGTGSLSPVPGGATVGIAVPSITGDALVAEGTCPRPDLMKIDVEGFEREVLLGLAGVLAEHRPVIVFEHSPGRLRDRGQDERAVLDLLQAHGYTFERAVSRSEVRPLTPADLASHVDIIATAPRA